MLRKKNITNEQNITTLFEHTEKKKSNKEWVLCLNKSECFKYENVNNMDCIIIF